MSEINVNKSKGKTRVPINISPIALSRGAFRDKAVKAYFENKKKRNLDNLNYKRCSNFFSESSDEECEVGEGFLEKLWDDYQSLFKNSVECIEFDIDDAIERYFSDKHTFQEESQSQLDSLNEEQYLQQEDELNELLNNIQNLSLDADSSEPPILCPICCDRTLEKNDEFYSCTFCDIKATSQTFSDFCTTKASHRQVCPSILRMVETDKGASIFCLQCGVLSSD